jgi:hypothetical protein
MDSWTEPTVDDLWVLGGEFEQSVPVKRGFSPWRQEALMNDYGKDYRVTTDGLRRISGAFGWSLRQYDDNYTN